MCAQVSITQDAVGKRALAARGLTVEVTSRGSDAKLSILKDGLPTARPDS